MNPTPVDEHQHVNQHQQPVTERERQIIITDGGRDRSSAVGVVVAGVLGVLVVLLLAFFLMRGAGDGVDVEVPTPDVEINNNEAPAPAGDSGETGDSTQESGGSAETSDTTDAG